MSFQDTSISLAERPALRAHRSRPAVPVFGPIQPSVAMPAPAVRPAARPAPAPAATGRGVAAISYRAVGKRVFDAACVLLAAPVWVPVVLVCALMIFLRDGGNPFYLQDRVGQGGRVFRMIKLRSMVADADARLEAHLAACPAARAEWDATQKLKRDPRITGIGRIIRKTSIDELPQLVNVLKGDMSLVGPRPFMTSQTALYRGHGYYRLRPGLTGFWQVSDRNHCDFAQRVHFDEAYDRTVSFATDLWVLARTVSVVIRGTGY